MHSMSQDIATGSIESVEQTEQTSDSATAMTLCPNQYVQVDTGGGEGLTTYCMVHVEDSGQAAQVIGAMPSAGPQLEESTPPTTCGITGDGEIGTIQVLDEDSSPPAHVIQTNSPSLHVADDGGSIQVLNHLAGSSTPAGQQIIQIPAGLTIPAAATQPQPVLLNSLGLGDGSSAPFYVMVSPPSESSVATHLMPLPAAGGGKMSNRTSRDDKRRVSHNEVERKRRDKMSYWIIQLSTMIPACADDVEANKKASTMKSKGGILEKACRYIEELQNDNVRMGEGMRDAETISLDNQLLKAEVEELRRGNAAMEVILGQHGVAGTNLVTCDALEG